MILHRFCSLLEYEKLLAGQMIYNITDHGRSRGIDASTAVGFCFFSEDPEEAIHWLAGNVDLDCCLTLDVPETYINTCYGRYPNWIEEGVKYEGTVRRMEYCCTKYELKTFKLISVTDKFKNYAPNARVVKGILNEIKKIKIIK